MARHAPESVVRDASRIYWEGAATRLAARVNAITWLEALAPVLFALSSATAIALYALRRRAADVTPVWGAWGAAALVAAVIIALRRRARWHGAADARVLLESSLRLDAALSAAFAGVAPWPAPRSTLPAVVRWRWQTAAGWLAGAVALLALGAAAPLLSSSSAARSPVEKPPALARAEAVLQELSKLDVVDPASLEQFSAQARELADRPAEAQYSHAALEAADALQEQTLNSVQMLAQAYDSAAAALGAADAKDPAASGRAAEATAGLDGQRSGRLTANRTLADAFKQQRQLSAEQRQRLRERLGQAGSQLRGVAGAAGREAKIARADGASGEGSGPGAGGIDRGRGDAPLTMQEQPAAALAGREQGVTSLDLERASLGDLTGLEFGGEHRVDTNAPAARVAGGAVATPARGGEAAWIDRLTPADRAALRELFK